MKIFRRFRIREKHVLNSLKVDFAMDTMTAMPAPPAQFNNSVVGTASASFGQASASGLGHGGHDDELALAGENVALIRSPAMKGNGHATILR